MSNSIVLLLRHSEKQNQSRQVETVTVGLRCGHAVAACIEAAVGDSMSEIQFSVKVKEMKELKLPNEEILKLSSQDSRGCRCF